MTTPSSERGLETTFSQSDSKAHQHAHEQSRMVAGGLWSVAGWGISLLVGVPLNVVLVRTMTVSQYGTLALGLSVVGVLGGIASFGLGSSVARHASVAFATGGDSGLSSVIRSAFRIVGAELGILAVGTSGLIALLVLRSSLRSILVVLVIMLPILFLAPVREVAFGVAQTTFDVRSPTISSVIGSATLVICSLLLVAGGTRSATVLAAPRAGGAFISVAILVWRTRLWTRGRYPTACSFASSAIAKLGLAMMASTLMVVAVSQFDVLILGGFHGRAVVGRYAPVSRLADAIAGLTTLLGTYLLPAISRAMGDSGIHDARRLYHWASRWALVACAPAIAAFLAVPGSLLNLLFGSRLVGGSRPAEILGLGVMITVMLGFNGTAIAAAGSTRTLLLFSLVGVVVSAICCLALIPPFGAAGAAGATTIALVTANIVASVSLYHRHRILPWDRKMLVTIGGWILGTAISALGSSQLRQTSPFPTLIVAVGAGMVTLAASILAGGEEDRMIFRLVYRDMVDRGRVG